jgi:WD40 repeat protein
MILNAATAQVVGYYGPNGGESHAVAFSPDGKYLAIGRDDSTIEVWDIATKSMVYTYGGHTADVFTLAWSPDSKRIASGGADATVQIWDALTGDHEYTYRGHLDYYWGHFTSTQEVDTLAWSPDGKQIASGGADNTIQVWQAH